MKIVLVGYMGSGKSSVGRSLAQRLGMDFLDLDTLIEQNENSTISEIFQAKREIRFRKLEHQLLQETLDQSQSFVLAVGGGTPVYYNNMENINANSYSIYLRMSPMQLCERLKQEKSSRPLIAHLSDEDLPEFIAKHLFERRNYYEMANFTLDVAQKSIEEISEEINLHLNDLQK